MRLYEGNIEQFITDVKMNSIANKIAIAYENFYRKKVLQPEYNSWTNSMNFLKNVVEYSGILDVMIVIEFKLPYSDRRIDVLLFGKDRNNEQNIILIELKQWSNDAVQDCETEGNILVMHGRNKIEHPHPSSQVEGYHFDLLDFFSIFEETPPVHLDSCVYCHNYSKTDGAVLYLSKFEKVLNGHRVFSKDEVSELGNHLKEKLENGDGFEVFNRFIGSPLRPSKKLLEHVGDMINKQQIFTLIDDQIAAYNSIMHRAKKLSNSKEKCVIIVKGGPGTGKSVIALEVMAELLRQHKNVYHATGSSAFTKTLRDILKRRSEERFKFFFHFTKHKENEIDVLICDEAHRIRKDSNDYGVPQNLKSKTPQIEDLIKPAKLTVFFIDEFQVVRPNEIGNIDLIKKTAKQLGIKEDNIHEFELKTQFRCSGSDEYLQWLENILGVRESDIQNLRKEVNFEFKVFDDPIQMRDAIFAKNKEKNNCARIAAGFCWRWSPPNKDGTLINDVTIGDFKMPWEKKNEAWKWATHNVGMEQVGTVYTAQGFEFDYIGIIFGKDLVYDPIKNVWIANPEVSFDVMAKRNNKQFADHLKHVYRVLLSRAHKGCYIYFMDDNTRKYFEQHIESKSAASRPATSS